MSKKLLVYMVDGVAAEHYAGSSNRFPHFSALEAQGFRVENLHAESLGLSLAGRTSMLTGVTADVSGVYSNKYWNGETFRYATPDDVRVPTIPQRAKEAGLKVAALNAGMIRQEDADIMVPPWWIDGNMIQRARDEKPDAAGEGWLRISQAPVNQAFVDLCGAAGIPSAYPEGLNRNDAQRFPLYATAPDHLAAEWLGMMATSANAPALIWAEFLMTDWYQHYMGYRSELAHWSVEQADMALGKILQRLRDAGVLDEWNIAVMSDHGHSEMTTTLYPQVIIPGVTVACEGATLLVAPKDDAELAEVTAKLADFGVEPFPNSCVPAEYREAVYVFVAPPKTSFEEYDGTPEGPTGQPKAISTHGLKPGMPGDDRFAIFAGPDVPQGSLAQADATQVAPTLAKLLGLSVESYPTQALF